MSTAPYQVCEWSDILAGQKSVSLGAGAYRRIVEAAGLILDDEDEDEGMFAFASSPKFGYDRCNPDPLEALLRASESRDIPS
jgi:hypothetical protein